MTPAVVAVLCCVDVFGIRFVESALAYFPGVLDVTSMSLSAPSSELLLVDALQSDWGRETKEEAIGSWCCFSSNSNRCCLWWCTCSATSALQKAEAGAEAVIITFIAFGLSTGCEEEVSVIFWRLAMVTWGGVTGFLITRPFLPGWVFFMWRRKLSERRKLNEQMLHE